MEKHHFQVCISFDLLAIEIRASKFVKGQAKHQTRNLMLLPQCCQNTSLNYLMNSELKTGQLI